MAKAAQAPKQKSSEFSELAGEVADELTSRALIERRQLREQAEQIFRGAVIEGRDLDYNEIDFLSGEVNYDPKKIKDEMRRMTEVVRNELIVGDSATRAKHTQNAAAAQAELLARGPEITEKITELQAELARLEKTAADFVRREEQIQIGLERLKKLAPPLAIARYNAKFSNLSQTLYKEINANKIDLQGYRVALSKDTHNQTDLQDLWLSYREFMVQSTDSSRRLSYAMRPEWQDERRRMQEMIPQLEQDIEEMQAKYDAELADIEADLQVYWN